MMDYEKYYSVEELEREVQNETHQNRYREMADRCVGTILDVGAGTGNFAKLLMDRGHRVFAQDVKPVYVAHMKGKGINAQVCHSDEWTDPTSIAFRKNAGEPVDTVVMGEFLEHLPNPGAALYKAFQIADKKVIFSIPNTANVHDPWHLWNVSWKEVNHLLVVEFQRKEGVNP